MESPTLSTSPTPPALSSNGSLKSTPITSPESSPNISSKEKSPLKLSKESTKLSNAILPNIDFDRNQLTETPLSAKSYDSRRVTIEPDNLDKTIDSLSSAPAMLNSLYKFITTPSSGNSDK